MYFGCPQPSGTQAPWADNVSTLEDFARLFEGVETLRAVESDTSRQIFLDNMIRLDASPGTSYSSPITGRTTGPLINELLRPIVAREAGRGSSSLVNEFMQHVTLRGKGGSGGPQGNEIGMSDFLEVSLPIKTKTGRIATQKYLVGWFVGQLRSVGPTLQAAEDEQLATFRTEIHAGPIRDALADW
jgi:hypothetical protein